MGVLRSAEVRKKLLRVKAQGPSVPLALAKGMMTHDAVIHATRTVTHDCDTPTTRTYAVTDILFENNDVTVIRKRNAATTDATSRILDNHSSGVDEHTVDRLKQRQPEVLKKLLTPADINRANQEHYSRAAIAEEEETQ